MWPHYLVIFVTDTRIKSDGNVCNMWYNVCVELTVECFQKRVISWRLSAGLKRKCSLHSFQSTDIVPSASILEDKGSKKGQRRLLCNKLNRHFIQLFIHFILGASGPLEYLLRIFSASRSVKFMPMSLSDCWISLASMRPAYAINVVN